MEFTMREQKLLGKLVKFALEWLDKEYIPQDEHNQLLIIRERIDRSLNDGEPELHRRGERMTKVAAWNNILARTTAMSGAIGRIARASCTGASQEAHDEYEKAHHEMIEAAIAYAEAHGYKVI